MEDKQPSSNPEEISNHQTPDRELNQPKRKRKRWPIVVSIVAVITVVAGIGGWVWHEQPSFCGAVCHDTMSPYVESWDNSTGKNFLASNHADADVACLDCHEPEISEQVGEAVKQVTGDYKIPLKKMETDNSFCLREGCHDLAEVQQKGSITDANGKTANPHTQPVDKTNAADPHNGTGEPLACADCHSMHRKSAKLDNCYSCHHTETFAACNTCHDDK